MKKTTDQGVCRRDDRNRPRWRPGRVKLSLKYRPTFVNLANAYLCSDCQAIGDSAVCCPRCESNALFAITRAIHRQQDSIRLVCKFQTDEPSLKAA